MPVIPDYAYDQVLEVDIVFILLAEMVDPTYDLLHFGIVGQYINKKHVGVAAMYIDRGRTDPYTRDEDFTKIVWIIELLFGTILILRCM